MSYQPPVQLWGSAFHLTGCKPYRGLRVTKADIHILRARPELFKSHPGDMDWDSGWGDREGDRFEKY